MTLRPTLLALPLPLPLLLPALATLASCAPITVSSVAYTTACPKGDQQCELRQNAETLYYMGQVEASAALMCGVDPQVRESMDANGNLCSLY